MQKLKLTSFFIITIFAAHVSAQNYILESEHNIRDDNSDFITSKNIIGRLKIGTEVKVLSTHKLRSGAQALQVEIVNPAKGSKINTPEGPFYIYQGKYSKLKEVAPSQKTEADVLCFDEACFESKPMKNHAVDRLGNFIKDLETRAEEPVNDPLGDLIHQTENLKPKEKTRPTASVGKEQIRKGSKSTEIRQPITSESLAPTVDTASLDPYEQKIQNIANEAKNRDIFEIVKKYEQNPKITAMKKWADRRVKRRYGAGECYDYVKRMLYSSKVSTEDYNSKYARQAPEMLLNDGYINLNAPPHNLGITPENAPEGSVIVYESTRYCDSFSRKNKIGCGHIEVPLKDKKGNRIYTSDYKSPHPITQSTIGSKYKPIGIFIKPQ